MKMTKNRWIGLIIGVAVFLSAFGAALAVTVFQVSREVPSTLKLGSAVVISDDNLALWHDQAKTRPVTSLEFLGIRLQPPLESIPTERPQTTIFIENKSSHPLTLISPCGDVVSPSGARIGFLDAGLHDLPTGGDGSTCGQNVTLGPMEMARANVHFHDIDPDLPAGDHTFTTVFGAAHVTDVDPIDPPAAMVGWWPGDGNALDIIGGNHGTLTGDFAPGKVGQGFSLDGTGDFVLVPDNPNLNITGDVTVDLWAKRKNLNAADLISKGGGFAGTADVPTAYGLFLVTGDLVGAFFERADGSNVAMLGFAKADTEFHHYAYVRSGDTHKVFRDGVVITADSFTGRPGDTTGRPLIIGSFQSDPNPEDFAAPLRGVIDEVEIFNRALSDAEIRAIFEAGSAGKIEPTLPTLPFLAWHFDTRVPVTPLDNPKVRSAIDLAINEAAIDPDFFFLPNWPSLEGAIQSFDLPDAQRLLAEAGFADGFGNLCIEPVGIGTAAIANEMVQHLAAISITAVVGGTSCAAGLLIVEAF